MNRRGDEMKRGDAVIQQAPGVLSLQALVVRLLPAALLHDYR
jgi:hypothetical protein